MRWPRNDLSHLQNHRQTGTLLSENHTKSRPGWRSLQLPLNPNMMSELATLSCSRPRHYRLFLPLLYLNFFHLKTSLQPFLSSLSFIYHIFCPTETFQRGRESHQSVTRRGRRPHRKLLIPAGMSWALENRQTQWTQYWCWSTIGLLKINPARKATAENFIMLMWRLPMS